MIRSVAAKAAWVGRTASMVFGLALVMALVIGAASTAWSATGGNFILGKGNVATTASKLTASVAGPRSPWSTTPPQRPPRHSTSPFPRARPR